MAMNLRRFMPDSFLLIVSLAVNRLDDNATFCYDHVVSTQSISHFTSSLISTVVFYKIEINKGVALACSEHRF